MKKLFDPKSQYVVELKASRSSGTFHQLFDNQKLAFKKYKELSENGFSVVWTIHENTSIDNFMNNTYNWKGL